MSLCTDVFVGSRGKHRGLKWLIFGLVLVLSVRVDVCAGMGGGGPL